MRFRVSSFVVLLFVLGTCSLSRAQIFRLQGGASTLFSADGGSINIKAPGYDSEIGIGTLNGHIQYGFLVRTKLLGNTLSVGDDTIKVDLPTDIFDSSHYFLARGVGLQHLSPKAKSVFYAFAGTASLGYSTPFFMASRSHSGLGIVYYERDLNDKLRFTSRNLYSDRQTSIQALEWTAFSGIKLSASGGIGSNQPYFATAAKVDRENLVVRAAYIAEGSDFQRLQVPSPISTEPEKANIAASYRIARNLSVSGSHENILQPATDNQPTLRAAVDDAYTNFNARGFNLGAGFVDSRTSDRQNLGINLYGTRAITRAVSLNANYFQNRPDKGSVSNTFTTTVREQLNQKLALTQTLIRSNGQTTAAFGGEFVTNRLNASLGYQTVYVPFNPDNTLQQALSFNVRVNLPRNMQLTAGSFVDPTGRVRYTVGIGTYLYRQRGMVGASSAPQSFRFPKFVAEGKVVDVNGNPVEGAAIHVDGKVAYSDETGSFMIRLDKAGPHSVVVAFDEFTASGTWEVVEAPAQVTAQSEDSVTPMHIVLRRVPARKPAAPVPAN